MQRLGTFNVTPSEKNPSLTSVTLAAERAEILICCYRRDDAANPEIFAAALVALFCSYPEDIVCKISDPVRGIPGRQKWFPSIAEIRHECEAEAKRLADIEAWHERENERAMRLPPPKTDRAAVLAKLRAQYPEIHDRARSEREAASIDAAEALRSPGKLAYWRSPMKVGPLLAGTLRRDPIASP